MNTEYIIDPETNRRISLKSKLGQKYVNDFLSQEGGKNQNCLIRKLLETIYDSDILFPISSNKKANECFLRGTFMFEDQGAKLFRMVYDCNHTQSFWKTTHSEARKQSMVDASLRLKGRIKVKTVGEKWNDTKDKNGHLERFYQYEIPLNPPFEFACDMECRHGSHAPKCQNNANRDPKGVVFLYHFITKPIDGRRYEYTFLKLEGHYSISLGHTKAAVNRYALKKEGKTAYSRTRREDCSKANSCQLKGKRVCEGNMCSEYSANNDYHVKRFKKEFPEGSMPIDMSVAIYSYYLRTGDELFVPQPITDAILISTDPELLKK